MRHNKTRARRALPTRARLLARRPVPPHLETKGGAGGSLPGGESLLSDPASGPHRGVADWKFPAGRPRAGIGAGGPGRTHETGNWCPGWRHRVAPLEPRSRIAPSVEGAHTPWSGRAENIARGSSPRCSKRAHACAEDGDPGPRHGRFLGTRAGEASNPGPAPLDPWDPDPAFTSLFATFGEGWVVFVFQGLHDRGGSPTLSFKAVAPLGGRVATFRVLGGDNLFSGLLAGQAYFCAEARPVLPHWEGAHEFHVGHPGSRTAVVRVRMAPSGLAWTTGDPKREG